MASLSELKAARIKKLERLGDFGMEAYPARVIKDMSLAEAKARFDDMEKSGQTFSLAGRIVAADKARYFLWF